MKRNVLACVAGLLLTIGMSGCGSDASDIPDGYTEDDLKKPVEGAAKAAPMSDVEGPTKSGG